jgi:outer membrane receptor for ferrienterochelin and colicins
MNAKLVGAILMVLLFSFTAQSQKLMGVVMEKDSQGKDQPVAGANVYWLGTTKGVSTKENGVFLIDRTPESKKLVISFVGYRSDTIEVADQQTNIKVELKTDHYLQEVVVEGWKPTSNVNLASGINVIEMDEKELFKAACCNLSESFETNPSVDVAFTDAITGTRQIQMLGLSGPNTMISLENMPGVRGLASSQGIQFIPGTWINSIQVTKGVGSVVNGYESIAGQINVELKKPQESDKLYVNGYINQSARMETNVIVTSQVTKKWATTFLVHGSARPLEMDQNNDSFLDFPKGNQVNLINRWVYNSGNGWLGQFSLKYLTDLKQGGQTNFDPSRDKFTTSRYGFELNTDRYEFTGKLGYQFPGKPYKSFGLQVNALTHQHRSYFGLTQHNADEKYGYANFIYQSVIGDTFHKFKMGVSMVYDDYNETLARVDLVGTPFQFNRTEVVPGIFYEYSYHDLKKFSLIAGIRVDQHNLFGSIVTPRVHLKYNLTETTTLRASAGSGTRVANIITENSGFLASSRSLVLPNSKPDKAYGFSPDQAWVYGFNFNQEFTLDYRPGNFSLDYFLTDFQSQAVADWDVDPTKLTFYSLKGKSFSHSVQAQIDYQLARRFDVRLAYRWLTVETDYLNGRAQRPLVPRDRAFINLAYKTKNGWAFDYTVTRVGEQRIPNTTSNPLSYQLPAFSSPFVMMNAQATKDFGDRWSVYLGIENITDFNLANPIVAATEPFNTYFDSSMVWGPVFGRMWYAGFRYRVK